MRFPASELTKTRPRSGFRIHPEIDPDDPSRKQVLDGPEVLGHSGKIIPAVFVKGGAEILKHN